MTDVENQVKEMAEGLGESLINRTKKFLKDEADTDFLKDLALELAKFQYKAMTAKTAQEHELAEEDMAFVRGRIDTFIARAALKVKNEFQSAFEEIIQTAVDVVVVVAKAALKSIFPL